MSLNRPQPCFPGVVGSCTGRPWWLHDAASDLLISHQETEMEDEDLKNPVLKALETSLSCSICYELYNTPLLLKGCGHSCEWACMLPTCLQQAALAPISASLTPSALLPAVCSVCIRQNLQYQESKGQPQCPSCRKNCDSRDLQANVALRDAVDKYRGARVVVLQLLREHDAAQQHQQQQPEAAAHTGPAETSCIGFGCPADHLAH